LTGAQTRSGTPDSGQAAKRDSLWVLGTAHYPVAPISGRLHNRTTTIWPQALSLAFLSQSSLWLSAIRMHVLLPIRGLLFHDGEQFLWSNRFSFEQLRLPLGLIAVYSILNRSLSREL
jgi:hypothetical protein